MTAAQNRIAAAKDTAQQMVTAVLAGDRTLAADLAVEHDNLLALVLVLADLCAHTHSRWTHAAGGDRDEAREGWAALMCDVEEWRAQEQGR